MRVYLDPQSVDPGRRYHGAGIVKHHTVEYKPQRAQEGGVGFDSDWSKLGGDGPGIDWGEQQQALYIYGYWTRARHP